MIAPHMHQHSNLKISMEQCQTCLLTRVASTLVSALVNVKETYTGVFSIFCQIQPIKDACCNYLKSQLSAANCLGIKTFAEFHNCLDLCDAAVKFADEQFTEVRTCSSWFSLNTGNSRVHRV